MAKFDIGETIICSIEVRDMDGILKDPTTSMQISIIDPVGIKVIDSQDMINDSIGNYHYDYTSLGTATMGEYRVVYTATDGARIIIQKDKFILE